MNKVLDELSKELGIKAVGVSCVTDYAYLEHRLSQRMQNGFGCEFEESDIAKRLNAESVMDGCRSIIAVAFPYAEGFNVYKVPGKGIISVSSLGNDYHGVLRSKLNDLVYKLNKYYTFNARICVDTSPLIDREVCRRAGLGSYGKNALLINKEFGSFMFLGYLIMDIKFEYFASVEESIADDCGECRLCIESCPGSAITQSGIINSSKCVSYMTQTKRNISVEQRRVMGSNIYGCDMCQLVCPKNNSILKQDTKIDYSTLSVNLAEIIAIDRHNFDKRYGHMAGAWRGRNVWRRNA